MSFGYEIARRRAVGCARPSLAGADRSPGSQPTFDSRDRDQPAMRDISPGSANVQVPGSARICCQRAPGPWIRSKVPYRCCGPTPPLGLSAIAGPRLACLASAGEFSRFCPIGVAQSRARGLSTPVCPSLDSLSPNRTASCRSPVQRRQVKAPNGSRSARAGCR